MHFEGSLNPHEVLRIKGETALQSYLVQEMQRVYRSQGVDINVEEIEVIVRLPINATPNICGTPGPEPRKLVQSHAMFTAASPASGRNL